MFITERSKRFYKTIAIVLCITLLYKLISLTVPFISDKLKTITVVSASLSFIDGGVVLAEQTISDFQNNSNDTQTEEVIQNENSVETQKENKQTDKDNDVQKTQQNEEISITAEPPAPARPANAGDIYDSVVSAGNNNTFLNLEYGSVKNISPLSNQELIDLSKQPSPIKLDDTDEPQVLIYHTHATESYQPYDCDWYDLSYNARNVDNSKNMVAVGNILEQKLKNAGIGVIHDTTQHDNPSYTGAYSRSETTINSYLEKYPSIKVILDVHRDALQGDNVITAPTVEIDGKKVAQIMIVATHDNNSGTQPNYKENFKFASAVQQTLEKSHPTITRPMLFDEREYNQEMASGALLVEVGGHGNTLSEAQYAMSYFADALIDVLKP